MNTTYKKILINLSVEYEINLFLKFIVTRYFLLLNYVHKCLGDLGDVSRMTGLLFNAVSNVLLLLQASSDRKRFTSIV